MIKLTYSQELYRMIIDYEFAEGVIVLEHDYKAYSGRELEQIALDLKIIEHSLMKEIILSYAPEHTEPLLKACEWMIEQEEAGDGWVSILGQSIKARLES